MIKHKCLADVMFLVETIAITSRDRIHITEKDIENIANLLINNITFERWKDKDLNLLVCGIIKGYIYANKIRDHKEIINKKEN